MARDSPGKSKGAGKSSTTDPPPKKHKQGDATSSKQAKGKQIAERSGNTPLGPHPNLKLVQEDIIKWYHSFVPYGRYISKMGINVAALERNFPHVLERLKSLKIDKLLEFPRHANLSMVKELYANWNLDKFMSWVRGKEVKLERDDLSKFLGEVIPTQRFG